MLLLFAFIFTSNLFMQQMISVKMAVIFAIMIVCLKKIIINSYVKLTVKMMFVLKIGFSETKFIFLY